jgi:hypothetical protein
MKRLSISQNNEVLAKIDPANKKEDRKVYSLIGCFDFWLENLKFSEFLQNYRDLVVLMNNFSKFRIPKITRFPYFCKKVQFFMEF